MCCVVEGKSESFEGIFLKEECPLHLDTVYDFSLEYLGVLKFKFYRWCLSHYLFECQKAPGGVVL